MQLHDVDAEPRPAPAGDDRRLRLLRRQPSGRSPALIAGCREGGRHRLALSAGPVLLLYVTYLVVRWLLAPTAPALGLRHASELLAFERRLGWARERSLQGLALGHPTLIRMANGDYAFGFLPVLFGVAAVAAWRVPRAFAWWSRVFVVTLGLGLIGFATYPLTPPRLLPHDFGFVDTLQRYGPHYYVDQHGSGLVTLGGLLPRFVNDYAAMPSLHVAWSLIAIGLLASIVGRWWVWLPGALYVGAMALTVIVTANHYVLDVLAGGAVFACATASVAVATAAMGGRWERWCTRWRERHDHTARWVDDALASWQADGRISAAEARVLRIHARSPAFRSAVRALGGQILVGFVAPFPLDSVARPLLVVGALALAWVRRRRHRLDREEWELARSVHTPLVALLAVVPFLGSYAYLAAPPLRANGLLLRVVIDAAFLTVPWHLYERSHLRAIVARPAKRVPSAED